MSQPVTGFKKFLINSGLAGLIRTIRRGFSTLYGTLFPRRQFEARRRFWEQRWGNEAYSPIFEPSSETIPKEVLQAVEDQWVPTGSRVLDIGCGSGWIAHWLETQGYRVLGVDYSTEAIRRAEKAYPPIKDRLEWHQADVVNDSMPRADFDWLLDRGCLHRIPQRLWTSYFQALRRAAAPGGKFLLLMATFEHAAFLACDSQMSREEVKLKVQQCADPCFTVDRVEDIVFDLAEGGHQKMPAVAFWMTARQS
jgi:SAM-dependent methyltransferase